MFSWQCLYWFSMSLFGLFALKIYHFLNVVKQLICFHCSPCTCTQLIFYHRLPNNRAIESTKKNWYWHVNEMLMVCALRTTETHKKMVTLVSTFFHELTLEIKCCRNWTRYAAVCRYGGNCGKRRATVAGKKIWLWFSWKRARDRETDGATERKLSAMRFRRGGKVLCVHKWRQWNKDDMLWPLDGVCASAKMLDAMQCVRVSVRVCGCRGMENDACVRWTQSIVCAYSSSVRVWLEQSYLSACVRMFVCVCAHIGCAAVRLFTQAGWKIL